MEKNVIPLRIIKMLNKWLNDEKWTKIQRAEQFKDCKQKETEAQSSCENKEQRKCCHNMTNLGIAHLMTWKLYQVFWTVGADVLVLQKLTIVCDNDWFLQSNFW